MHLRELARVAKVSPTAMTYELRSLAQAGLVLITRDGNRLSIRANSESPIYEELKSIARKTTGLTDIIRHALRQTLGVHLAFVFGSMATGMDNPNSDIDLLVVTGGDVSQVYDAIPALEQALHRTIHLTIFTSDEWEGGQDTPVIKSIRDNPKFTVIDDATTSQH